MEMATQRLDTRMKFLPDTSVTNEARVSFVPTTITGGAATVFILAESEVAQIPSGAELAGTISVWRVRLIFENAVFKQIRPVFPPSFAVLKTRVSVVQIRP